MDPYEIIEISLLFLLLLVAVRPLGSYMASVYQGEATFLSRVLVPCENLLYRICGIEKEREMSWKYYAFSLLLFNLMGGMFLFAILLLQGVLPLNPQKLPAFSWHLALNTATSFMTNTNWQNYGGESTASYFFSQMIGLTVQNFLSAATGMVVVIALIRGIIRRKSLAIGNLWVDMTRTILYILLPLSLIRMRSLRWLPAKVR